MKNLCEEEKAGERALIFCVVEQKKVSVTEFSCTNFGEGFLLRPSCA